MRSTGFTLILALLALMTGGVAAWRWTQGSFDAVFGAPPERVGQRIYRDFTPAEVRFIRVSRDGVTATFELRDGGWYATAPWQDRMDPRAAVGIINFTLGMRVEDVAEMDDVDAQKAGLKDSGTNVRLEGEGHRPLAKYKIGRQTPWLATVKDMEKPVPTVFVQPRDEGHKHYVYACTGDINALFKDGFRYLRDHHPFYFNPLALKKIRIDNGDGSLTLARDTPQAAWRLTMPLEAATDKPSMVRLLEGLYELQAVAVTDRTAVAPAAGPTPVTRSRQIAITPFGTDQETVLEIFPPESPAAATTRATVSDRPDTVLELPLKPEPDLVSLADIPLEVNDLRDATFMTDAERKKLRGILIAPATGQEILISRSSGQKWQTTIGGVTQEANEERLFALLKAVTESKATDFKTDAATDFSVWGLDRPFLILRFLTVDNETFELRFGRDGSGAYFVNRLGTPTVMEVDPTVVSTIPVRPYEWRQARLWSIDRVNLMEISISRPPEPPLKLRYTFNTEQWTATRGGEDATSRLEPSRARYLLDNLEGLKASRWLSSGDEVAHAALAQPSLEFTVIEKGTDAMGDFTGLIERKVRFAPATTEGTPLFYYGQLEADPFPFLLDRETYGKLAAPVMESAAN